MYHAANDDKLVYMNFMLIDKSCTNVRNRES